MKKRMIRQIRTGLAVFIAALFPACEYDIPPAIYPGLAAADPVIESVTPESATGGATEFRIRGAHFSPEAAGNFVYFGQTAGAVLRASGEELLVMRPLDLSGTVTLQVAVAGAFGTGRFGPFPMEKGISETGEFGQVYSIAVDAAENLYAAVDKPSRTVMRVTPDGAVAEYGTLDFKNAPCMRPGPGGCLYVQKDDSKSLYRIPAGGGEAEEWLMHKKKVSFFDFDVNGNIFAGGEGDGLCATKPDGSESVLAGDYEDRVIRAVRVHGDYVYVGVSEPAPGGIWRNRILSAEGLLGENELVLECGGPLSGCTINDITFDEDGALVVATDRDPDPVWVLHTDGTLKTLYPGYLESPATQVFWGNGNYLYMNKSDLRHVGVIRIIMGKKGAVYHGRS
ncbi:hypothetical protein JW906_04480 [bacterium]|nr:hypothetical protein [bacterium]